MDANIPQEQVVSQVQIAFDQIAVVSLIEEIENYTLSKKGLSWHDGSEAIAYYGKSKSEPFNNLVASAGAFPIRDNYGNHLQNFPTFQYNDVTYRLIPLGLWLSIEVFINTLLKDTCAAQ